MSNDNEEEKLIRQMLRLIAEMHREDLKKALVGAGVGEDLAGETARVIVSDSGTDRIESVIKLIPRLADKLGGEELAEFAKVIANHSYFTPKKIEAIGTLFPTLVESVSRQELIHITRFIGRHRTPEQIATIEKLLSTLGEKLSGNQLEQTAEYFATFDNPERLLLIADNDNLLTHQTLNHTDRIGLIKRLVQIINLTHEIIDATVNNYLTIKDLRPNPDQPFGLAVRQALEGKSLSATPISTAAPEHAGTQPAAEVGAQQVPPKS